MSSPVDEEERITQKFNLFTSRPTTIGLGWGNKQLNLVYTLPEVYHNAKRDFLTSLTLPTGDASDWLGTLGDFSSRIPLAPNVTWVLDNHAKNASRVALRIETFKECGDIVAVVERFERPCRYILPKRCHGTLHPTLSPPETHSSYKYLLYVAEKEPCKYDAGRYGAKVNLDGVDPHEFFHCHESFGEQMTSIAWPKAFVSNNHGDIFEIDTLPSHTVILRAVFSEHDCASLHAHPTRDQPTFRVYLLALELKHRRLGMLYCANRPMRVLQVAGYMSANHRSCQFQLKNEAPVDELIADIAIYKGWVFALRYQTDLIQPHQLGNHSGPAYLVCAPTPSTPAGAFQWRRIEGVPVLFPAGRMMRNTYLAQHHTLLVPTVRKHKPGWLAINLATWKGEDVPSVQHAGRFLDNVVDFYVQPDSPHTCYKLTTGRTSFMADIRFTNYTFHCKHEQDGGMPVKMLKRDIKWYPNIHTQYNLGLNWSSVPGFCYYRTSRNSRKPGPPRIALYLHGGPNSLSYRSYYPIHLLLADELDWDLILYPNYRGSLGISEEHCKALVGHVGVMDVGDCRRFFVEHIARIFRGRFTADESDESIMEAVGGSDVWPQVIVIGGSHGGFLGAHLIGQHPLLFSAAVLMNPVIDLVTAAGTSDIPDILNFEADAQTHAGCDPEEVWNAHAMMTRRNTLTKASPLLWVAHVRAPVLVFISGGDLRVPSSQGREYYHALRALGKTAEMYFYANDNHTIAEPRNCEHMAVTSVQFLQAHTLKDVQEIDATPFLDGLDAAVKQCITPDANDAVPSRVLFEVA